MSKQPRFAVLGGLRTPFVKAFGRFADISAVDLGAAAIRTTIQSLDLDPADVDEVVMGNVAGPADAANIARVIALTSGIPAARIAHTVNRNCGSGLEAILGATHAIRDGRSQVVIAGGTESMSNIPLLVSRELKQILQTASRTSGLVKKLAVYSRIRPRHLRPVIGIQLGLTDPTCGLNMGQTAEILANEFGISREAQDAFAVESHHRANAASERCFLSGEIAPWIETEHQCIDRDIGPRSGQSMEQLAKLRPIFEKNGTVTAGNSCSLTDGAAALVLAADRYVTARNRTPLGYVAGVAISGCSPRRMGLGPVYAVASLLQKTGLQLADIELLEINEAFASQVLSCLAAMESSDFARHELGLSEPIGQVDRARLNVNGGAIALGHPVGTTGARLVLTMLRALRARGLHRGIVSLCIGGGQGMAVLLETE